MKLPAIPGITPVSLGSVEQTAAELHALLKRIRGRDAARDPGLEIAATQTAEQAHQHNAGLVAVVEHPNADPAMLVAWVVAADLRADPAAARKLSYHLAESGGPDIREVAHTETATGYPVVIVERIPATGPLAGAQLQVIVVDKNQPRIAVFTLHAPTGRGWLELAGVTGQLVTAMEFTGIAPVPETRGASDRQLSGMYGKSAPR